jgi:hypothetical protein
LGRTSENSVKWKSNFREIPLAEVPLQHPA